MGVFEETFSKDLKTMSTSSLSTNGYSVASKEAFLNSYIVNNIAATTTYLKIYNISGAVNMGTDTPFIRHAVPAGTSMQFTPKNPIHFSNGINVCAVSGPKDDGVGNPAAGDLHGFFMYS